MKPGLSELKEKLKRKINNPMSISMECDIFQRVVDLIDDMYIEFDEKIIERPTTFRKNNLPLKIKDMYCKIVEDYQFLMHYENGSISDEELIEKLSLDLNKIKSINKIKCNNKIIENISIENRRLYSNIYNSSFEKES